MFPSSGHQSFGNRALTFAVRAGVGMLVLVSALCLLIWNEVNVVAQHQSLDSGKRHTVSLGVNMMNEIDPGREGTPVHITGDALAVKSARDIVLGVTPSQALRLARHVEMYQWIEEVSSSSNDAGGTAFTYTQGWQTMLHTSDEFQDPEGHENPTVMPFTSEQFVAAPIQVGAFVLSDNDAIVQKFNWFEDMEEGVSVDRIPNETIRNRMQLYGSSGLYYGDDPSSPQVGDLRITYHIVPSPQTVSIIAAQVGNTLAPYQTFRSGYPILLFERGSLSAFDMYDNAQGTIIFQAWKNRMVGILITFAALLILAQPFLFVGTWIPLVRDIIGTADLCAMLPIAVMIEVMVIAITWLAYQPFLALMLLAIVVGYFNNRLQEARNAPTAEGYVVGNTDENEADEEEVEMPAVCKE